MTKVVEVTELGATNASNVTQCVKPLDVRRRTSRTLAHCVNPSLEGVSMAMSRTC